MLRKTSQLILISILLIIALGFGASVGYIAWIIKTAPDVSKLSNFKPSEASTIYSADGEELTRPYIENRIYVPLSKIPMDLQNALVSSEDQKFWEHNGINIWAILRAIYIDLKHMSKVQGASTITQQLARGIALHQKKFFSRKIQEIYLAIQLERMYTKEEILEMYLNQVFLGHSAQGVQTAAQQYFGKDVENLTLGESAMLIGILPAPNAYSPYVNKDRAVQRRDTVLNLMVDEGYISIDKADRAKKEDLKLAGLRNYIKTDTAPYFVSYVREQVMDMFGYDMVYRGGLKIYTTLDPQMQNAAEDALANALDPEKGYLPTINRQTGNDPTQPQVALISIDPQTGQIKAMVGGRGNDKFNRTVQAYRQPGSAFKPIAYVAALEQGYSPGDVVNDIPGYLDPGNPNPWPSNYNDNYEGPMTLRYALTHSVNVATVRLQEKIGINASIQLAERLGFTSIIKEGTNNDRNLGFALGGLTKGVTPIELASAYGVFANRGIYVQPSAIVKVEDSDGHVLYQASPSQKIVMQEDIAYQITSMLRSVVTNGTGWRAANHLPGRPIAGKTGTTSDSKDAWFVGYTPDVVTSVWIGEDSPRSMIYDETDENGKLLYGSNGQPLKLSSGEAARLWGEYMGEALENRPVTDFERPANLVQVKIDPATGLLPNQYTPKTITETYREGLEPTEIEQLHQPTITVGIDKATGQLATPQCPPDQVVQYTYQEGSGIRVGPATLRYSVKREGEDTPRNFIYTFEEGVPVVQIDPKTGVPVTDDDGNYLYQYMPTVKCEEHSTGSATDALQNGAKKLVDTIWNFFNSGGNSN